MRQKGLSLSPLFVFLGGIAGCAGLTRPTPAAPIAPVVAPGARLAEIVAQLGEPCKRYDSWTVPGVEVIEYLDIANVCPYTGRPLKLHIADGAVISADELEARAERERRRIATKQDAAESGRREKFIRSRPGMSPAVVNALRRGVVVLGMATVEAQFLMGKPERVNRSVTKFGSKEQWVYGSRYFYFDDGVLTSWQE